MNSSLGRPQGLRSGALSARSWLYFSTLLGDPRLSASHRDYWPLFDFLSFSAGVPRPTPCSGNEHGPPVARPRKATACPRCSRPDLCLVSRGFDMVELKKGK